MSEIRDLRLKDQIFVRTYKWRRIDPVPWSPLAKPLADSRLGLVSSAGLSLPGQGAFVMLREQAGERFTSMLRNVTPCSPARKQNDQAGCSGRIIQSEIEDLKQKFSDKHPVSFPSYRCLSLLETWVLR